MGQRVIRINQHKPDGGMWDLADFLNVIENEGEQWNWMIMVVDEDGITFSSPRDFDCALVLTYPEMVHFARGIFQTTLGLFLGDSDPEKLYALDRTLLLDFQADQLDIEIALEMVDSSYWLVSARNETVLRKMEEHFREELQ